MSTTLSITAAYGVGLADPLPFGLEERGLPEHLPSQRPQFRQAWFQPAVIVCFKAAACTMSVGTNADKGWACRRVSRFLLCRLCQRGGVLGCGPFARSLDGQSCLVLPSLACSYSMLIMGAHSSLTGPCALSSRRSVGAGTTTCIALSHLAVRETGATNTAACTASCTASCTAACTAACTAPCTDSTPWSRHPVLMVRGLTPLVDENMVSPGDCTLPLAELGASLPSQLGLPCSYTRPL